MLIKGNIPYRTRDSFKQVVKVSRPFDNKVAKVIRVVMSVYDKKNSYFILEVYKNGTWHEKASVGQDKSFVKPKRVALSLSIWVDSLTEKTTQGRRRWFNSTKTHRPTDRGSQKMAVLVGVADRTTIVCKFGRCSEPLGKDSPKRDNQGLTNQVHNLTDATWKWALQVAILFCGALVVAAAPNLLLYHTFKNLSSKITHFFKKNFFTKFKKILDKVIKLMYNTYTK